MPLCSARQPMPPAAATTAIRRPGRAQSTYPGSTVHFTNYGVPHSTRYAVTRTPFAPPYGMHRYTILHTHALRSQLMQHGRGRSPMHITILANT